MRLSEKIKELVALLATEGDVTVYVAVGIDAEGLEYASAGPASPAYLRDCDYAVRNEGKSAGEKAWVIG